MAGSFAQFFIEIGSAFNGKGFDAASNSINDMNSKVNNVSKTIGGFITLLGVGGLLTGLYKFGKASLESFGESEKQVTLLSRAMVNLGNYTKQNLKIYTDYALELQRVTKFSDEQIIEVETLLTTYGLYGDKLKEATKATLDLSYKTGSLQSASELIGKAYQGNTTRLAMMGLRIKENIVGSKKFEEVMRLINERFGGMAQADATTYAGKMAILANKFDDIKEKIGGIIALPVVKWLDDFGVVLDFLIEKWEKMFPSDPLIKAKKNLKEVEDTLKNISRVGIGNLGVADTDSLLKKQKEYTAEIMRLKAEHKKTSKTIQTNIRDTAQISSEALDDETSRWEKSHKAMLRYYKDTVKNAKGWNKDIHATDAERVKENKKTIKEIEDNWDKGSKNIISGWKQAILLMKTDSFNWTTATSGMINSVESNFANSFKQIVLAGDNMFTTLKNLADAFFQSILQAFFDMLAQMAARAAVYGLLSTILGMPMGGFDAYMGFPGEGKASGGAIDKTGGYLLHAGEYVLSPEVVGAIKKGSSSEGKTNGVGQAGGKGINFSQTINIQGGGDTKKIVKEITEATRRGVSWAIEGAKVGYKAGSAKSGEIAI